MPISDLVDRQVNVREADNDLPTTDEYMFCLVTLSYANFGYGIGFDC